MKNFLLKSFLFLNLVFMGQVLLIPTVFSKISLFQHPMPDKIKTLDFFMKEKSDIVFFGDSTVDWAGPHDPNTKTTAGLLQSLLPKHRVAKITYRSYNVDVYLAYVQYMRKQGYQPTHVIVPINLRSFSPQWDRHPLWQFEQERLTMEMKDTPAMIFYKPLSVFKYFDPQLTDFEYQYTKVYKAEHFLGRVKDFERLDHEPASSYNVYRKLSYYYLTPIGPEHRKVRELVELVRLLRSMGIQPVIYLTPIDIQTGLASFNKEDRTILENKITFLKDTLDKEGVALLDLSTSLPTSDFTWTEEGLKFPTEHLKLRGRMLVAKTLAKQIETKNPAK